MGVKIKMQLQKDFDPIVVFDNQDSNRYLKKELKNFLEKI